MGARKLDCIGVLVAVLFASGCEAGASEDGDLTEDEIALADNDSHVQLEERGLVESAESIRPLVLVAGLMQDEKTVAPLADALRAKGLDVTVWIPANSGLDDINGYAKELGETVDNVLRRTDAAQVDLVGHSEGGLTARQYVKNAGAEAPVHTLVSLGSPQQGTEGGLLSLVLRLAGCEAWAPACRQMVAGSAFLKEINGGDPTPGDVRYVTVGTRQDGVVQPVTRAGILGAENVIMQDVCRNRAVGHFGLLEDGWVHQLVIAVLAGGRADADCRARPIGGRL